MKFQLCLLASAMTISAHAQASYEPFYISPLFTYSNEDVEFDESTAEIVSYDEQSQRFFVVNAQNDTIDVLKLDADEYKFEKDEDCNNGQLDMDLALVDGAPNSVAVKNGLVAVAIEADTKQDIGVIGFYNSADCSFIKKVDAGALPDMVTFSPNGKYAVAANEGEPNDDYTVDPEGSITIVKLSDWSVTQADFTAFNSQEMELKQQGIRIFGPGASVAQDLEPEYISIIGRTAYVSLQENNALAIVNLKKGKVTSIHALGTKDFSKYKNALDFTNKDDTVNITTAPFVGMYQPDAIAAFKHYGHRYIVTANEGDARDYDGFSEEIRVEDFGDGVNPDLDPDLAMSNDFTDGDVLGRPKTTNSTGDTDGDGDIDIIHLYGARSISVWKFNHEGKLKLVADTGSTLEKAVAEQFPALFNATNDEDGIDDRSDDKGPEPEAIIVEKIKGIPYAFVGLERSSQIAVFDLSDPYYPTLVQMFANRVAGANASKELLDDDEPVVRPGLDLGPEGLDYIHANKSPIPGVALLAVANEVSGTTTLYTIKHRGY